MYKGMTTECPGGLAHLLVDALFKKYEPDDRITKMDVWELFSKENMKIQQYCLSKSAKFRIGTIVLPG